MAPPAGLYYTLHIHSVLALVSMSRLLRCVHAGRARVWHVCLNSSHPIPSHLISSQPSQPAQLSQPYPSTHPPILPATHPPETSTIHRLQRLQRLPPAPNLPAHRSVASPRKTDTPPRPVSPPPHTHHTTPQTVNGGPPACGLCLFTLAARLPPSTFVPTYLP